MVWWTLAFLVIAGVAGFFGFGVLASASAGLAQAICFAFLAMGVVCGAISLFDLRKMV